VTNFNFTIAVFLRNRSEVIKKGIAYNWDNTGYGVQYYYTGCKYGLNFRKILFEVNPATIVKLTCF